MKTLLMLTLAITLAGCVSTRPLSGPEVLAKADQCKGANNKDITIRYGESKIDVTPKVTANKKNNDRLVIALVPDPGYESVVIEIRGKNKKSDWIDMSLAKDQSNNGKFPFCIDQIDVGTYKYKVSVPDVGVIDPRVDIKNEN